MYVVFFSPSRKFVFFQVLDELFSSHRECAGNVASGQHNTPTFFDLGHLPFASSPRKEIRKGVLWLMKGNGLLVCWKKSLDEYDSQNRECR